MQLIAAHAEHTFLVRDRPDEERALSELLGSVIARAGFGLMLITSDRRIVYANDAVKRLIRAHNGLDCKQGRIDATDFAASRKLQSLITAASRQTDGSLQGGPVVLRNEDGMASLIIHVVPLPPRSMPHLPDKENPAAGLVIVDSKQETIDRIKAFADLFGLTSAEARVFAQLISGSGLTKAAVRLNIARSTARAHLTHILEKTGTHRQAELIRVFYETTLPSYGIRRRTSKQRQHLGVPRPSPSHNYKLSLQPDET